MQNWCSCSTNQPPASFPDHYPPCVVTRWPPSFQDLHLSSRQDEEGTAMYKKQRQVESFFFPLARKMIVFPKGYTHEHFCFIFHWPKVCHMTAVTRPAARWPVQFGFSIGHCCCLTCNPVSAPWVYQGLKEHTLNRICLYWYNHLFYVLPYHLELSFSVIEIQNLGSHLRPAESETLGLVIFCLFLSLSLK